MPTIENMPESQELVDGVRAGLEIVVDAATDEKGLGFDDLDALVKLLTDDTVQAGFQGLNNLGAEFRGEDGKLKASAVAAVIGEAGRQASVELDERGL